MIICCVQVAVEASPSAASSPLTVSAVIMSAAIVSSIVVVIGFISVTRVYYLVGLLLEPLLSIFNVAFENLLCPLGRQFTRLKPNHI